MSERFTDDYHLEKARERVRASLTDIKDRSLNPNLLDRATLPIERWGARKMASMLGMAPEDGTEIGDSE